MLRSAEKLADVRFDLLVIGGGIYGAWTAYDAALRGLKVALIERRDWGAGTSQASSKLIHGGLRYLERFQIGLVRKALAERQLLLRIAAHRVRPLRFLVPLYRDDRVGRLRLGIGLKLYDLLGAAALAPSRSLGRAEVAAEFPFLRGDGLTGAVGYSDAGTDDARLTLEVVAAALAAGAVAVNYVEATGLIERDGRVAGAVVRDQETGASLEVEAAVTVNAAGAWADHLERRSIARIRLTRGTHLVLPSLGTDQALLRFAARDGRVFFLIPWYGRTLVGTTDVDHDAAADAGRVPDEDVDYLLAAANQARRDAPWTRDDVIASFVGLRVLADSPGAHPSSLSREWSLGEPRPWLLQSIGGKLTAARTDAARIVDRAFALLGRPQVACVTGAAPLPWAPPGDLSAWLTSQVEAGRELGLDADPATTCALRHGTRVGEVFARVRDDPDLGRPCHPELPFLRAELAQAAAGEMALHLDDVLRRRVPVAILARLTADQIGDLADVVAAAAGWSATRRDDEVANRSPLGR